MATAMPTAIDTPIHPTPTSPRNNPSLATQIDNLWDGLVAVQGIAVGPIIFNAKLYGAVGNGSASDGAAINAAITAANAFVSASGGAIGAIVYLPPGCYNIETTINLLRGVSLRGANAMATILRPAAGVVLDPMITTATGAGSEWDTDISDLMITATPSSGTASVSAIKITKNAMTLTRLRILNCTGKAIINQNYGTVFDRVLCLNNQTGISLQGDGGSSGSNAIVITKCILNNSGYNIRIGSSGLSNSGIWIAGNDLESATIAAIYIETGTQEVTISGNRFENNNRMLVTDDGCVGIAFTENGGVGSSSAPPTNHLTIANSQTVIANNYFDWCSIAPVVFATTARLTSMKGNIYGGNGGGTDLVADSSTNPERNTYDQNHIADAQWRTYYGNGTAGLPAYSYAGHTSSGAFYDTVHTCPGISSLGVQTAAFPSTGAANDLGLLVYDVSAGALVRASRGAADSGGAGFRQVLIPN